MCRPIFIAATRQNVGKTTVSLALMSGLLKRFGKVGFIKPVGQHHVAVAGADGTELRVDKDVVVMKEFFGLDHLPYEHMSPVRCTRKRRRAVGRAVGSAASSDRPMPPRNPRVCTASAETAPCTHASRR
jgi:hypothetical protein